MEMWTPIGNKETHYWFYFFYEMIHFVYCYFITVGHDLLFPGFVLCAAHQFDLLSMRINALSDISKLPNSDPMKQVLEKEEIKKIVQHHLLILE